MGLPVVTVASGGLPIVESTVGGTPITEASNGYGVPVTKVVGKPGMPVVFETIGVTAPGPVFVTLDATTVVAVTLSGGNLVATNTGTTSQNQGAKVALVSAKAGGKYYFECTITTFTGGSGLCFGVGPHTNTYTNMGGTATGGVIYRRADGNSISNGSAGFAIGIGAQNDTFGAAIDQDNGKYWFKKVGVVAGNWNGSGTANPATNIGGGTLPAGSLVPFVTFGFTGGLPGNVVTLDLGASAFVGAVPAGFTSGWPV